MTREEQLAYCKKCAHKVRDLKKGIICKLTGEYANFEGVCENFIEYISEEDNPKKWEKAQKRYFYEKELICPVCGNNEFTARRTLMVNKTEAFCNVEQFSRSARNFICTKCKHVLWFY